MENFWGCEPPSPEDTPIHIGDGRPMEAFSVVLTTQSAFGILHATFYGLTVGDVSIVAGCEN